MDCLKPFKISSGSHTAREDGMCVMEATAYLAGEPHSDSPECACPIIGDLAIRLNDACNDDLRQERLADMPWRLVGTRSPELEKKRCIMYFNWSMRTVDHSDWVPPDPVRYDVDGPTLSQLQAHMAALHNVAVADCTSKQYAQSVAGSDRAKAYDFATCAEDKEKADLACIEAQRAVNRSRSLGSYLGATKDALEAMLNDNWEQAARELPPMLRQYGQCESVKRDAFALLNDMIALTEPKEPDVSRHIRAKQRKLLGI